ncbi:uncharacterized protein GGS22DRAFT_171259 [Annulohypoxylon maeteangense]|uniref:uncharacterized protein n=1 Tax=Annulohypoxylon maeteangense TaxID=1927788 RepID=UPI0020084DC3|nr:uncharacterized protein GGS22DRAFT_171259 [Annulohypoxylon maeteangense]KAI0881977.1 hypothetical protein GGS22DRAFT_171259 [Annulohypoxylon maeteangense]
MSSHTPTYIPSPNWDIPADSDMVVLGRLIKDPKNPQSKILKSSDDPIPPPKIYEGEKTDWQTTLEQVRSGSIGLWAKCLQFIEGQLSFSQLKSSMEEHKFATLETRYFLPDEDYLAQALEDTGVQAYLQVHNWRKPVYIITGIKIARGASISTESNVERSAQAGLKVDATSVGVPVEMGPEASWESKKKRGISYGGSTDYIFAYQLTSMKPKKKGKEFSNKSYVKGAVFGKGEKDGDMEVKVKDAFDIEEVDLGFPDTCSQVDLTDIDVR